MIVLLLSIAVLGGACAGGGLLDPGFGRRLPSPIFSKFTEEENPYFHYDTKQIEQPVDHFNETDKRTFNMRYIESLDYWKAGGPLYLMVGDGHHFSLDELFISFGFINELARETNGALFMSELRYFGVSQPVNVTIPPNHEYLTLSQALADLAQLARMLKSTPAFSDSKLVVVGASLGGSLAAWLRARHPDVVDAAFASGALMLADLGYHKYYDTINDNIKRFGFSGCHDTLINLFKYYEEAFKTPEGIQKLKAQYNICNSTDMSKLNNQYFFAASIIVPNLYMAESSNFYMYQQLCEIIKREPHNVSKFNTQNTFHQHDHCKPYDFEEDCKNDRDILYLDLIRNRYYLLCSQLGFFPTTSKEHSKPFGNSMPLKYFYSRCDCLFGLKAEEIKAGVKRTNEIFGGLKQNGTRIIHTSGDVDPWRWLGMPPSSDPENPSVLTPGQGHAEDLQSFLDLPEPTRKTVRFVKKTLKKWLDLEN